MTRLRNSANRTMEAERELRKGKGHRVWEVCEGSIGAFRLEVEFMRTRNTRWCGHRSSWTSCEPRLARSSVRDDLHHVVWRLPRIVRSASLLQRAHELSSHLHVDHLETYSDSLKCMQTKTR